MLGFFFCWCCFCFCCGYIALLGISAGHLFIYAITSAYPDFVHSFHLLGMDAINPHSIPTARFAGNPHIVAASSRDYQIRPPSTRTTFPEPLPIYLSRNAVLPPAHPAARDPNSANAGRFSMSLKGMRRDLRKAGPRAQMLAKEVEEDVVGWLRRGGVVLDPDGLNAAEEGEMVTREVGTTGGIVEVERTPLQLVWLIEDDAFARYVVHCCARYHSIVSFSQYPPTVLC